MEALTIPPPVPADEYIDNLWKAVKAKLITWPELNALQATYLRDQRPIPLPTIEEIRGKR